MMTLDHIHMRDPFVVPQPDQNRYIMVGTTDPDCWNPPGIGFDAYTSSDLETWEGPYPIFRPESDFWADRNFWAPELHAYRDRWYLFATFKAPNRYRGTQILASGDPLGPFKPLTEGPVTPDHMECLDGTLYVDEHETPWMVFCHEWTQVHNGAMMAMPLTEDLTCAAGQPHLLFRASDAAWAKSYGWPEDAATGPYRFPQYVTDGPFLHRLPGGDLVMLWSSRGEHGYAMGLARSRSGGILGPWEQQPEPLWSKDGGHGMLFHDFDGHLHMTLHHPNDTPNERPVFVPIRETEDQLLPR
jgi:beta-xylosidase